MEGKSQITIVECNEYNCRFQDPNTCSCQFKWISIGDKGKCDFFDDGHITKEQ